MLFCRYMAYDLTALETMCGGDPKFMHDFIELFIQTTPPYLAEIRKKRANSNWEEIGEILHKIKPTVELFGMQELHVLIRNAEQAGRFGKDADKLPGWLDEIVPGLEKSIESLKTELDRYRA